MVKTLIENGNWKWLAGMVGVIAVALGSMFLHATTQAQEWFDREHKPYEDRLCKVEDNDEKQDEDISEIKTELRGISTKLDILLDRDGK